MVEINHALGRSNGPSKIESERQNPNKFGSEDRLISASMAPGRPEGRRAEAPKTSGQMVQIKHTLKRSNKPRNIESERQNPDRVDSGHLSNPNKVDSEKHRVRSLQSARTPRFTRKHRGRRGARRPSRTEEPRGGAQMGKRSRRNAKF